MFLSRYPPPLFSEEPTVRKQNPSSGIGVAGRIGLFGAGLALVFAVFLGLGSLVEPAEIEGEELPTAGRYRPYLQFRHGGAVRTAELTLEVPR
jgi:hypothetical protein